ncbi:hypothetical protein, partial [uncultured Salinicola sp.]|uniref:hypothetical protein n=1 Tax=uncultured Salinicola sp. TaxID=1193542 RepID=UPI00260DD6E1
QLDLPAANTSTGVYRCDGTDSPNGRLGGREPCCIGEVAPGGVATEQDVFARATLCNNLGSMPVGTSAQRAAYVRAAGACVEQRVPLTGQRFKSLEDIGNPPIDFAASSTSFLDVLEYDNGNVFYRQTLPDAATCYEIGYYAQGGLNTFHAMPQDKKEQCYQGRNMPISYVRKITDTYRQQQIGFLESEADKIAASMAQKGYNGYDIETFWSSYGGYNPQMNGQTTTPWIISEVGRYVHIQAQVPHGGLCTWYRGNQGINANQYDTGYQYPSYCWYSKSQGWRFQRNITTPYRQQQQAKLKREATNVFNALMAGSYSGFDLNVFRSGGGVDPDMQGFTDSKWKIASWTHGPVSLRIDFPTEGFCRWFRDSTNDGNFYNTRSVTPEWCGRYNQYSDYYYQFDISEQYRAKQKAVIERERKKMRAAILQNGGTYAIHSKPDFQGALPDNGVLTVRSGKTYYTAPVDDGLCDYLVNEAAARGAGGYINFYDFHYRPVTCHNNGGIKAYLDLTVD